MPRLTAALAYVAGTVAFITTASAHHGWGSYDASRVLTLEGTVVSVHPDNPHAKLQLRAQDEVWRVTLSPPARMSSRGKPIAEVKAGDRVIAVGYPSKSNPNEMRAERITHNGVTVELR